MPGIPPVTIKTPQEIPSVIETADSSIQNLGRANANGPSLRIFRSECRIRNQVPSKSNKPAKGRIASTNPCGSLREKQAMYHKATAHKNPMWYPQPGKRLEFSSKWRKPKSNIHLSLNIVSFKQENIELLFGVFYILSQQVRRKKLVITLWRHSVWIYCRVHNRIMSKICGCFQKLI